MNLNPYAVVTVELPHPLRGAEIAELVKTISVSDYDGFYSGQPGDGDLIEIGRVSEMPDENVAVCPSTDIQWFSLDKFYDKVVVLDDMSHTDSIFCIGYDDVGAAHTSTVKKFAEMLRIAASA